ncbi:Flp family type IVb pilin [Lichenicoccus roseus]|uniref:Flp family type IVb pilin n=1 Tax=Lichenicoccus roseus TaxID=2683649 RepID=A0A5R9J285_9PROT|nr:Flp family type IVb pilin [Lichenicoccus roseus]TLU71745.1 Flp family type IVb pilin [Lichenicoccus roseus]
MLAHWMAVLVRLKQDRRAVTALEYALIAGLIALVIVSAVTSVGTKVGGVFLKAASSVASA